MVVQAYSAHLARLSALQPRAQRRPSPTVVLRVHCTAFKLLLLLCRDRQPSGSHAMQRHSLSVSVVNLPRINLLEALLEDKSPTDTQCQDGSAEARRLLQRTWDKDKQSLVRVLHSDSDMAKAMGTCQLREAAGPADQALRRGRACAPTATQQIN